MAAAQLRAGDRKAAEATLGEQLAAVEEKRAKNWGDWRATQVEVLVGFATAQAKAGDRAGARATLQRVEESLKPGDGPEQLEPLRPATRPPAKPTSRS